MADGLTDFTGKEIPKGYRVGDTAPTLTDFTGKTLPKGYRLGGKDTGTAISAGASPGQEKNWFDTHTENLAQHAYNYINKKGHPELADEVKDVISKAGPHSATDAAVMGATTAMPLLGKIAPAVEESAPLVAKALKAAEASGVKGAAARAAITGAAGGAAGGVPGAVQGVLTSGAGDVISAGAGGLTGASKAQQLQMDAAAPAAAEQAAQEAVERRLGMTAEQAGKLASPPVGPSPEMSEMQAGKVATRQARTTARKEVSVLYDPIYSVADQAPVAPDHLDKIARTAQDAKGLLGERGQDDPLTKPTRDLLDEFSNFSGNAESTTPGKPYDTPESIRAKLGETGPQPGAPRTFVDDANAKRALSEDLYKRKLGKPSQTPEYQPSDGEVWTIGKLRGRDQALTRAILRQGITNPERDALVRTQLPIKEALDYVLTDEQKPVVRSIDAAYASVINRFPNASMKPLREAGTLPAFGKAFAELPAEAHSMVLERMDPSQKAFTRKALASYILSPEATGKDVFNLLERHSKDGLFARVGFPDDFQKVNTWRELASSARKIYDKPPDMMQADEFRRGVREGLRKQGMTPELMDKLSAAAQKERGSRFQHYVTNAAIFSSMGALSMSYGGKRAMLAVPLAVGYYLRQAAIENPSYRAFLLNGYSRAGGDAFARFAGAGLVNATRQLAKEQGLVRPDKEREAEAKP